MLLARATVREREMAVRAALGAGRVRNVRQLLVESLLLGLSGAIAGCVLAYAGLDALVGLLPPNPLPGEVAIRLDTAALAFSLATAIASALLFGIAPALHSARHDLVQGLKSGGGTLAGGRASKRLASASSGGAVSHRCRSERRRESLSSITRWHRPISGKGLRPIAASAS
jgi:putative ABC transport system permease protein